jgi:hypothetical protein
VKRLSGQSKTDKSDSHHRLPSFWHKPADRRENPVPPVVIYFAVAFLLQCFADIFPAADAL